MITVTLFNIRTVGVVKFNFLDTKGITFLSEPCYFKESKNVSVPSGNISFVSFILIKCRYKHREHVCKIINELAVSVLKQKVPFRCSQVQVNVPCTCSSNTQVGCPVHLQFVLVSFVFLV